LRGKLIVIEGADGVGRSTQVWLLKQWLETKGHAVLATRMTRSDLAGKGLRQAKKGTTLGRVTMALFYATDFADRLENEIIPALRAGFVMLTDRYIDDLVTRVLQSGGFDYWESGMDRRMGEDLYESFVRYQKWLLAEFDKMVEPYGFDIIDASSSVEEVFQTLRGRVDGVIGSNGI